MKTYPPILIKEEYPFRTYLFPNGHRMTIRHLEEWDGKWIPQLPPKANAQQATE